MVIDSNYQQFDQNSYYDEDKDESEETPRDSGVMIQVVPESEKSRWNHVEDLDSFFTRMYHYHQNHGFTCMMLQEILELVQFIFVVFFSIFLFHCVDYSILFKENPSKNSDISISDAILPLETCFESMGLVTWISILVSCIFWILCFVKVLYHFFQFWDIKSFYNVALMINDKDLDNLTWHEVQKAVIEVQKVQEMCIHKRELTELDIYHRVLRFKNYTVAMINKSLLPVKIHLPLLGDIIFMTRGLKYNLELILFWGPWSPFENNWHLQEDYKKLNKRHELANSLSKHILWIGITNFVLCPLIFLWQILYFFFNYGELVKREPGALGTRMWSLYGRLYLRHFNELDHELNARLNRAYRPASKYMNMFTSPLVTIIAKNVAFISGSIFVVLLILTCYDEDFFTVKHVLMIMTVTGSVAAIGRSLIPDENLVWCPETLLTAVLAHTHYRPDSWRNQAHTQNIRSEVAKLFQYRALHVLEELVSPILTPYILCFMLRCKSLDIVDFYRNFTIEVTGVGDICSFAQMDVKNHGSPMWQNLAYTRKYTEQETTNFENFELDLKENKSMPLLSNKYTQAEDGKTELSLVHFTLTNPEWKPPSHAEYFVTALRERAKMEATYAGLDNNPLIDSLSSLSSLGPEYNDALTNILRSCMNNQTHVSSLNNIIHNYSQQRAEASSNNPFGAENFNETSTSSLTKVFRRGANKAEGTFQINEKGLLQSLKKVCEASNRSLSDSIDTYGFQRRSNKSALYLELTAIDMSLSALYLHELHHRQITRKDLSETSTGSMWQHNLHQGISMLPELGQERIPLLSQQNYIININRNS